MAPEVENLWMNLIMERMVVPNESKILKLASNESETQSEVLNESENLTEVVRKPRTRPGASSRQVIREMV